MPFYFKAGAYAQATSGSDSDVAEVRFTRLLTEHGATPNPRGQTARRTSPCGGQRTRRWDDPSCTPAAALNTARC